MVTKKTTPSKKSKTGMTTSDMDSIVSKMLENDELPDGLADLDPLMFARSLATYRDNALGSPRYVDKINVSAWADASEANLIFSMMDKALPELTGAEMESAMSAINVHLDYSVMMGSHSFMPVIMPNGALLIRNHHRVLGLTDSPQLSLKITTEALLTELQLILDGVYLDGSEESRIQFLIIHRDIDGSVQVSQKLPLELSLWGQTLIFIGSSLDLSASDFLNDSGIRNVCDESRSGIAVLRTFGGRSLVYGMERVSDELDTVLEEYADRPLEDLDEPLDLSVCLDYKKMGLRVSERTLERLHISEIKKFRSFMRYYIDNMMISTDNFDSYASQKRRQIMSLQPIFALLPNRPVHAHLDLDPRWEVSEEHDHCVVFIELPMSLFESLEIFEQEFEQRIKNLLKSAKLPKHDVRLFTSDNDFFDSKALVKLGTKAAGKWVKETLQKLLAEKEEMGVDEDEDLFGSVNICTNLVLIFDHRPDLIMIDRAMKQATESNDCDIEVHLPHMGFSQGYECGGYDSGNVQMLLTQEEQG